MRLGTHEKVIGVRRLVEVCHKKNGGICMKKKNGGRARIKKNGGRGRI